MSVVVVAAARRRVVVILRLLGDVEVLPLCSELDYLLALIFETFATWVPPKARFEVQHATNNFCNFKYNFVQLGFSSKVTLGMVTLPNFVNNF